MAFSEKTLDFLFENRVVDSKAWFEEHRQTYNDLVLEPMRRLVEELTPWMLDIDPLLICEPKVGRSISRIFRDTRFTRDKHLFRDVMWCSFFRRKQLYHGLPGFFFEFSPRCLRWGCGYYQAPPEAMEAMRTLILAEDESFLAAERALSASDGEIVLEDTRYKRSRYPHAPERLRPWLDQRSICFLTESTDFSMLYDPALAARLGESFRRLTPMYRFMMKAESRVPDAAHRSH